MIIKVTKILQWFIPHGILVVEDCLEVSYCDERSVICLYGTANYILITNIYHQENSNHIQIIKINRISYFHCLHWINSRSEYSLLIRYNWDDSYPI